MRSVACPALGGSVPAKIEDRHINAAIDKKLHGFVILMPHELMQDAGGLMGAPLRIDIGSVREKKVGDLEVVVENCPRERGIQNILGIGLAAEPGAEVAAVVGIVSGRMIRQVAQRGIAR